MDHTLSVFVCLSRLGLIDSLKHAIIERLTKGHPLDPCLAVMEVAVFGFFAIGLVATLMGSCC